MTLTLSMLRCPDNVAPETRRVAGGEYKLGRGPANQWILPDPDRIVSTNHCVLAFRGGGWQISDISTNGTFLNRESEAIGPTPRELRDGDRLRLGPYEIEVRIAEEAGYAAAPAAGAGAGGFPAAGGLDPFALDPFAPAAPPPAASPGFGAQPPAGQGIGLPADFDPLAPDPGEQVFAGPTQADHTPAVSDAFRPPLASTNLLPDDWDLDLGPAKPAPPPAASALRAPERLAPPPPMAPPPVAPPVPPPVPPPVAPPVVPLASGANPFDEPLAPPASPALPPAPAAAVPAPAARPVAEEGGLLAVFLHGAGMAAAAPAGGAGIDAGALMESLGRAFRALVSGLRQVLIARAEIKGEFRIEQTMIRARGNNPLKFSAGDDDALAALLGLGRRTDMSAEAAVADALRDIRLHELATVAALQAAARALLARLDPAPLRASAEQGGLSLVPAQKKARAWDGFEKLHAEVTRALADDFDSVFGKAFARAYEQALHEAAAREPAGPAP